MTHQGGKRFSDSVTCDRHRKQVRTYLPLPPSFARLPAPIQVSQGGASKAHQGCSDLEPEATFWSERCMDSAWT